jgi:catechol 2,3-dioxygenase-like lactoylglutathione lyase family enzyme
MAGLLEKSLAGVKAGAISIDSKVLGDLGCFDRSMSGSGTICAAAAIYIGSKYAPDPQNGIAEAANSTGADTDTLASMAGGLLGVIAGTEWLQRYRNQLQDERYITELAQRLESLEYDQSSNAELGKPALKPATLVQRLFAMLPDRSPESVLELPDGREATIKEVLPLSTKSKDLKGRYWMLRAHDGQTLYIKKLERAAQVGAEQPAIKQSNATEGGRKRGLRLGAKVKAVKVIVRNLERSRWFYREVLGLKVTRESRSLVNFGGVVSLISREHIGEFEPFDTEALQTKSILCIECSNIAAYHDQVRGFSDARVSPIQNRSGRKTFSCFDLDGNVIEVYESPADKRDQSSSNVSS